MQLEELELKKPEQARAIALHSAQLAPNSPHVTKELQPNEAMSPIPTPKPRTAQSPPPPPPQSQKRAVWSPPPPQPPQSQNRAGRSPTSPQPRTVKSPTPEQQNQQPVSPPAPTGPVPQQQQQQQNTDIPETPKTPPTQCKSPGLFPVVQPTRSASEVQEAPKPEKSEAKLPEEDLEYTEQYGAMLKDMAIKAIEEQDYVVAVQRMQEFIKLSKGASEPLGANVEEFKKVVELFLVFSVAIQEADYPKCLHHMKQLIIMAEGGHPEAKKCSELGVRAAINHITDLRERVVCMTGELHEIEDPDDFDRVLEQLRREREKVESSNMMLETCMRGSDDAGKSETVLACISYGFKVGRLSR